MNIIKRIFPAVILSLIAFGPSWGQDADANAESRGGNAKLHVILVGDTNDSSIGVGVAKDIQNMKALARKISNQAGMELATFKSLTGDRINLNSVANACKQLTIAPDDAVIFHYSGHGFHTDSMQTKWPALVLPGREKQRGMPTSAIFQTLKAKNPRLLLVMADCCNNLIPEDYAPPFKRGVVTDEKIKANYRALFRQARGAYIASGSIVGQFSWGNDTGGFYTLKFIQDLDNAVHSNENPSWNKIFATLTATPIYQNLQQNPPIVQQAQFEKNPDMTGVPALE